MYFKIWLTCILFLIGTVSAAPVFHYSFEDNVLDSTDNAHNATLKNGAGFAAGKIGQALDVRNNNQYALVGDVDFMDTPDRFSVAFWFNRFSDGSSSTNHGTNNVILGNSSDGSNDNFEIGSDGSSIDFYIDSGGKNGQGVIEAGIENNKWHHVVLSYDHNRSNEIELFVDGASIAQLSDWSGNLSNSGSSPVALGVARPGDRDWGDFNGLIDELYLFDNALNAQEVNNLFQTNNIDGALVPEPQTFLLFLLALAFVPAKFFSQRSSV